MGTMLVDTMLMGAMLTRTMRLHMRGTVRRALSRVVHRLSLLAIGAAMLTFAAPEGAGAQATQAFSVRVVGKGRPMLLIPGMTNGGAVWDDIVKGLEDRYELHVFTLAGFAGQPAVVVDSTWLARMRDSVTAYVTRRNMVKPVIVGHSLGGFLALWIAATSPDLPSAVVNIDGLPFLGATANSAATVDTVRPQAQMMRRMMTGANGTSGSIEGFARMQQAQLRTMMRDTTKLPLAAEMGRTSDLRTIAEAMYQLYTTDLRDGLGAVRAPVLNLHAWAAYKGYGMTRERIDAMLASQYRTLRTGTTAVHDSAYHFIMFDEPAWTLEQMKAFLAKVPAPKGGR